MTKSTTTADGQFSCTEQGDLLYRVPAVLLLHITGIKGDVKVTAVEMLKSEPRHCGDTDAGLYLCRDCTVIDGTGCGKLIED